MSEAEEDIPPTPASKQTLIRRIMLVICLQYLFAFIVAEVVTHISDLYLWLEAAYFPLLTCFLLTEAILISNFCLNPKRLRGILGYVFLILFSLLFVVIFGGILPAMVPSLHLGLGMFVVMCFLGLVYALFFYPQGEETPIGPFKAHVVVPVALLVSIAMYGVLLAIFHTDATAQLMIWTFAEGIFIIYYCLVLEDIQNEPSLGQEDWCSGAIKVYSETVLAFLNAFQSKSGLKGK